MLAIAVLIGSHVLHAECASFYCPLENTCGGTPQGVAPTFSAGVNGNAACFGGSGHLRFADPVFNTPRGSVSLWFRKNSADEAGGIWQIGQLGQPNSIGLFYNSQVHLYLELRNNAGGYRTLYVPSVLSQSSFAHVVAAWEERGGAHVFKLFINGTYAAGDQLAGPFLHEQGYLDLGIAGAHPWYGRGTGCVDELRFFNWALSDAEIYAEYVYSSNRHRRQASSRAVSTGPVKLVDGKLVVEGKPFKVKGAGYQPLPVGACNSRANLDTIYTHAGIMQRDLPLLRAMHANTVRLWAELPDATLLDALYNGGVHPIYAIMAIQVPASAEAPGIDYADPATIAQYVQKTRDYVRRFKDHPAVLAWGIGNENNLHYAGDVREWYALADRLAAVAHEEEGAAYHPTMIINGYMLRMGNTDHGSDDVSLANVDLWGHNSYGGYDFHCYFDYYGRISAKPLIVTEFGVDAYNISACAEAEAVHSEWVLRQWDQIRRQCLGGTVMEYSDEWWKGGCHAACDPPGCVASCSSQQEGGYYTDVQPDVYTNEEWWGLMRIQDNGSGVDLMHPRQAYHDLAEAFFTVAPDFDHDNDVDAEDYAHFESCATGPAAVQADLTCGDADVDGDGDVDLADFGPLQRCLGGADQRPRPDCAD